MNARTYPRTSAEAFKGLDYACSIERPASSIADKAVMWACVIGFLAAIAAVIWG